MTKLKMEVNQVIEKYTEGETKWKKLKRHTTKKKTDLYQ
jgi:hypothetical protein